MLEAYRAHVTERQLHFIPPKPLYPECTAVLFDLLNSPPNVLDIFLLDLFSILFPPAVDEPAYV